MRLFGLNKLIFILIFVFLLFLFCLKIILFKIEFEFKKPIDKKNIPTFPISKSIDKKNISTLTIFSSSPIRKTSYLYSKSVSNLLKCNIEKNTVLIIEPALYHHECTPGFTKYFLDLGYKVDVILDGFGSNTFYCNLSN